MPPPLLVRARPCIDAPTVSRAAGIPALLIAALIAGLAGCALPEGRVPAPGPDAVVLEGEHVRLVCHTPHRAGARRALAAAEAAWTVAAGIWGRPEEPLDEPVEVHIHPDVVSYERTERALTGGRFRRNLAFSHHATRTAHVALQPPLAEAARTRLGLPAQTLRLVAHETVHLVSYLAVPAAPSLPRWLDEGAASHGAQKALVTLGLVPRDPSEDPWAATYQWAVARRLATGDLPRLARLLEDDGPPDDSERYAVDQVLFGFLEHERPAVLEAALRVARGTREPRGLARRVRTALERAAGPGGLDALDRAFRRHVASLRPRWIERHRALSVTPEAWVHTAFPRRDALASCRRPRAGERLRVRGVVEPLAGPGLFVRLETAGGGAVDVVFAPDGGAHVARVRADGRRAIAAEIESTAIEGSGGEERDGDARATGRGGLPFDAELVPGALRLRLGNGPQQAVLLPGLEPGDGWALGARRGAAGLWRGIQASGLPRHATDGRAVLDRRCRETGRGPPARRRTRGPRPEPARGAGPEARASRRWSVATR